MSQTVCLLRVATLGLVFSIGIALSSPDVATAQLAASGWSSRVVQLPESNADGQRPVITAVTVHPNAQTVAIAGDDHVVYLWNLANQQFVQHLRGHRDWIRSLAYTPDGSRLISAGNDRRILSWDANEGNSRELVQLNVVVTTIAPSPDGQTLAALGFDRRLRLIDTTTGSTVHEWDCPCADMRALAWSPAGGELAAAGRNGKIREWDALTGRVNGDYAVHRQRIRALRYSPDGEYLVSGSEDRTLRIRDLHAGEQFALSSGNAKVMAITFCGPGLLASGGSDNLIRIWDLRQQKEIAQLDGHTGSVAALAYQGEVLVSSGYDATLRIWTRNSNVAGGEGGTPRVGSLPSLQLGE